ncbi:MAG: ABC transporter ATP-binding protein [Candidatus Saccharibacteria bacterium]
MAILETKNLTKQYGDFKAIDSVSFEAHEGEIFGLLGPNGAGKTTTIRAIATVLAPTSGTATVDGYDIVKDGESVRRTIGVLTTEIGVYGRFSGRENLEYFGQLYSMEPSRLKQRIDELSALLVMDDFLDKRASDYSTGMKQKLAIARSVIHDPKVIIFDEPTSGLDVLASQTVLNFMRKAKELNKCVLFSTHQMPDAERLCDRTAIIHKGRVVFNDTIAKLKQETGTANLEDAFLKLVNRKGETA